MTTKKALFLPVEARVKASRDKVSVVGTGMVGTACIFGILASQTSGEVAIVDMNKDKLAGELMDFQHGAQFLGNAKVMASTDFEVTAGSKVCVVTAGVRQQEGESRLALVQRNTDVLKHIIPKLVQYSPDTILLMVSNPVDILTYVAWKLSGLPRHKVLGTGTNLDSARFNFFLSEKLEIAPSSCAGWIIGEHGDNSVPVWSLVNVGGTRLKDLNENVGKESDPDEFYKLHKMVIDGAGEIIKLKGYTSWGIGATVTHLVGVILKNSLTVEPISTFVKGVQGIDEDVCLSMPAILGEGGVNSIVQLTLSCPERSAVKKTATILYEIQQGVKL